MLTHSRVVAPPCFLPRRHTHTCTCTCYMYMSPTLRPSPPFDSVPSLPWTPTLRPSPPFDRVPSLPWTQRAELVNLPLPEDIKAVAGTCDSLLAGSGSVCAMLGKPMPYYSWRAMPAYSTAAYMMAERRTAARCLRLVIAAHPSVIHLRDSRDTHATFLQHAVQRGFDPELISTVLASHAGLSLVRDEDRQSALLIALHHGQKQFVRLLLQGVVHRRLSLLPSALQPLVECFEDSTRARTSSARARAWRGSACRVPRRRPESLPSPRAHRSQRACHSHKTALTARSHSAARSRSHGAVRAWLPPSYSLPGPPKGFCAFHPRHAAGGGAVGARSQ